MYTQPVYRDLYLGHTESCIDCSPDDVARSRSSPLRIISRTAFLARHLPVYKQHFCSGFYQFDVCISWIPLTRAPNPSHRISPPQPHHQSKTNISLDQPQPTTTKPDNTKKMSWFQKQFTLPARSRGSYLVTDHVVSELPEIRNYKVGMLNLFVQHTSCALSLNENWDDDVRADMSDALDRIAPEDRKGNLYRHSAEGEDDMPVCFDFSSFGRGCGKTGVVYSLLMVMVCDRLISSPRLLAPQ